MTRADTIGIVADRAFLLHRIPQPVRESPARLLPILRRLESPEFNGMIRRYPVRVADESDILSVHSEMYLNQIRQNSLLSNPFSYDKDTYLMEQSLYTASSAAGSCMTLADALMAGEIRCGFALVRPPGHHAGIGNGQGFCIINNVAVAAGYLQRRYNLRRILIVDFDAHHGNGTEEIFYEDPGVLIISIHQRFLFPSNTGMGMSIGRGEGRGYTVNVPVHATFGDVEYNYIFGKVVHNIILQYAPEFILVSAGFDGHIDDSMSELSLSTDWYRHVAELLKSYSLMYGINRLLYVLEGGYHIKSLEASVAAALHGLSVEAAAPVGAPFVSRAAELIKKEVLPHFEGRWDFT